MHLAPFIRVFRAAAASACSKGNKKETTYLMMMAAAVCSDTCTDYVRFVHCHVSARVFVHVCM
eukprot:UN2030